LYTLYNIILPEPSMFFHVFCDLWLCHLMWLHDLVTLILTLNSKNWKLKINQKENENRKENENKSSPPLSSFDKLWHSWLLHHKVWTLDLMKHTEAFLWTWGINHNNTPFLMFISLWTSPIMSDLLPHEMQPSFL